jgi:NTE family protein
LPNGASADHPLTTDPKAERLEDTLALCLSGGGYRAMLFHLGTLSYLNDAGFLPKLARISSVSGGSITAGVLALQWKRLTFDAGDRATNFHLVVDPIRNLAATTIDAGSVIRGILTPFVSICDGVIRSYRKIVFGDATLQDFPDHPLFVINATNVQTGSLFRFSKPYLGDWRIGIVKSPRTGVAEAVAASSAFPPILSPSHLEFQHSQWTSLNADECGRPPFTTKIVLTDGGVYDNMGIENPWKRCRRVLVSDGGGRYQYEEDPHGDWARHSLRINATIDNQVRSLRRRQIVSAFVDPHDSHSGAYWSMWTQPSDYPAVSALRIGDADANALARTPTRLAALPATTQNRIINFGYGMAERAIRSYYDTAAFAPQAFPYPGGVAS